MIYKIFPDHQQNSLVFSDQINSATFSDFPGHREPRQSYPTLDGWLSLGRKTTSECNVTSHSGQLSLLPMAVSGNV